MRVVAWALLVPLLSGCSSTVYRLREEVPTPAGPAKTDCERQGWLVVARTKFEEPTESGRVTHTRKDGLGLYRVGSASPVSIPAAADELRPSAMVESHEARVRPYDNKRVLAATLGGAGLIALTVGTVLFATSFHEVRVNGDPEQRIDATQGTWSGITIALGFGLAITGLTVNPSYPDRARAEASRYVFVPPHESEQDVTKLVGRHNDQVRKACRRIGKPKAKAD